MPLLLLPLLLLLLPVLLLLLLPLRRLLFQQLQLVLMVPAADAAAAAAAPAVFSATVPLMRVTLQETQVVLCPGQVQPVIGCNEQAGAAMLLKNQTARRICTLPRMQRPSTQKPRLGDPAAGYPRVAAGHVPVIRLSGTPRQAHCRVQQH